MIDAVGPSRNGRSFAELVRLAARQAREIFLLRQRLSRIEPVHRSRFQPAERQEIVEHGERWGFSARHLARLFLVTPETIGRWKKAIEKGRTALVGPLRPIRAFHQLAAEVARMLRRAHPHWGCQRIAQTLTRLGLEAARTSVQRYLRRPPPKPAPPAVAAKHRKLPKGINPKRPHHVWIMDFTTVTMILGFLPIRVGAVLDSFSRKIVAISLCRGEPDAKWTCRLLRLGIWNTGKSPDHVITDQGCQFKSKRFRKCLSNRGIRHRFGPVGSSKSIGRLERFWRSLKAEWATALLCFATERLLTQRLRMWVDWYHRARPHQGLDGRTPHEVERRRGKRRRRTVMPGDKFVLERRDQPCMPVYRLRKIAS